jgi:hypothetical protein
MLVDAGYSGDWSRIGVISKSGCSSEPGLAHVKQLSYNLSDTALQHAQLRAGTEMLLQKVALAVVIAHTVTGVIAARLAPARSLSPAIIFIRVGANATAVTQEIAYVI